MLYLDQLFDEIFNNFFSFPERARRLLTDSSGEYEKRFPTYPVSNFYIEKDGTNIMEFAVPGFSKDDIDVSVADNILTIKGERNEEENDVEGRTYVCRRLARRSFKNSYKLPTAADVDNIDVSLVNGMLKVVIPIKEQPKSVKQLPIK